MTPRLSHRFDNATLIMEVVPAVASMVVLLVVAASLPYMGFAAAESLDGQKLYGVLEGDWMFLFGLIAAGTCISRTIRRFRRVLGV